MNISIRCWLCTSQDEGIFFFFLHPFQLKAASGLAGNETVLFIFLRPKIKEFIGLIQKSQCRLKTKAEWSLGLFSLKEQSTETKCAVQSMTSLLDSDYQAGFKAGFLFFFFFLEARLPFIFFSAGRVRLCLHSLDGDYKYMENSRQNKVSNFISSKNIVPLSSSGLTVLSRSLTYCWMETQPVLHHYTVAQAARKYQPFIKSGPLSWNIKGKIKQMSNVRAKLLTDVWLSPL